MLGRIRVTNLFCRVVTVTNKVFNLFGLFGRLCKVVGTCSCMLVASIADSYLNMRWVYTLQSLF